MHTFISLEPGAVVESGGKLYVITRPLDLETVLAKNKETGEVTTLNIGSLNLVSSESESNAQVESATLDKEPWWSEAEGWFNRLRPLASAPRLTVKMVEEVANDAGVHISTVYRKLKQLGETGKVSSLKKSKSSGGKGKSRLSPEAEAIILETVNHFFFNKQKQKRYVKKVVEEIDRKFRHAELTQPHRNTIYKRIRAVSQQKKDEFLLGVREAQEKHGAFPGKFPAGNFPLDVVQIDHTLLDIILVDDTNHLPIGRPWITLAIDVFSRMVVGFYVSLDPPSTMSVGLCLVNAILPKDKLLAKYDITVPWSCWGKMRQIHADNAKEFRGDMLRRACKDYGMDLEWRPVEQPRYGAHIERLLGTFLKEIHSLPGTTFSNPRERGQYDSEKHAAMTLSQFEKWLVTFITGVYHQRLHSSLQTTPIKRYETGIFGDDTMPGRGLPPRIHDEDRLRLDLMPYTERTIQGGYGVQIDEIHYFSDVLRRHVNVRDPQNPKRKVKFTFRRDPRDISTVYFYDPDLKQYFRVPYRDLSNPPMSLWEYRKVRARLKEQGAKDVNERLIFETLKKLRTQEEAAVRQTKTARRNQQRRSLNKQIDKPKVASQTRPKGGTAAPPEFSSTDITPYDELEELLPMAVNREGE